MPKDLARKYFRAGTKSCLNKSQLPSPDADKRSPAADKPSHAAHKTEDVSSLSGPGIDLTTIIGYNAGRFHIRGFRLIRQLVMIFNATGLCLALSWTHRYYFAEWAVSCRLDNFFES
jgi:hypothetical protein